MEIDYTLDEITTSGYYMPTLAASAYYSVASPEILKKYDSDSDCFVDAVCFIYSSPMDINKNLWAWCYNFSAEANVDKPNFRRHMWCLAEAFSNSLYAVDAHTAIHETGHLLGLRDYYPSDNNYIALGGHSMMDYNISDHDPYTKMMLGWAQPTYYDLSGVSSVDVTLNPFQQDGSFILLKNNWNHTVMDEYLLLEFYTPEFLNGPDSKMQYTERPLGFTKPGLKIYHADSRLSELSLSADGSSFSFKKYVVDSGASLENGHYYMIGANNNESSSYTDASRKGRYKQIAIVENKKINTLQSGPSSDDDSLFYVGDKFDSSDSAYLLGGNYNDKSGVNVAVEVTSIDGEKINLRLSNLSV